MMEARGVLLIYNIMTGGRRVTHIEQFHNRRISGDVTHKLVVIVEVPTTWL